MRVGWALRSPPPRPRRLRPSRRPKRLWPRPKRPSPRLLPRWRPLSRRPRSRRPLKRTPRTLTSPDDLPLNDAPAIDSDGGCVRLRLDIAYDGTDFAGWATQADQRTVAGVLEGALSTVFRSQLRLRAAGRTDTGVHATGQVAHVDVPAEKLPNAYPRSPRPNQPEFPPLARRLGRLLPSDVRVRQMVRAPAGFDSRFSALRRHYVYRLSTSDYGVEPHQARYITAWPRRHKTCWG